jgi:hypothetical protein
MAPRHEPLYKQMPGDVQFALTPIQFRRIKTEGNPSPTVLEALRSHLVERGRNEPAPNMTLTGR